MLKDTFGREINYLRISVTDRCNLRCVYCMPPEGVRHISHDDILSFEEIAEFTQVAVQMGIDKVRLTGGEPLVRRGIIELVKMLARIEGINDFAMTTNGQFLEQFAKPLKNAGLQRVNISLDTINPALYTKITVLGKLENTLKGIEAAQIAGLTPIKINCVVKKTSDESDALEVAKFATDNGFQVRFIREMDLANGKFWVVEGGNGGNCSICNRIRLSSDGYVRPCLFSDIEFNVRKLGSKMAIIRAVHAKPEFGKCAKKIKFYSIGG